MNHLNKYVKKIVSDHHTVAFIGFMFILMGLINLNEHFLELVLGFQFKTSHGFILMGIFNILFSITFLLNGISTVENSLPTKEMNQNNDSLKERIEILEKEIKELKNNNTIKN